MIFKKLYNNFQLLNDQHKILQDQINTIEKTKIIFKNGSSINIIASNNSGENTRGNRAKINPLLFDWEHSAISDETFEEICKPYLTK